MQHGLVSVVIPTFNRAYCLARAIDSALQQTYDGVDVVLVDDGSTDDTAALVKSRYGDEPRVRYLQQSNQGVSAARNTGLAAAEGEFIAFLDSDDVWHPWKLAVQVGVLRRYPQVGMVWTEMEAIDAQGRVTNPKYLREMYAAYQWFTPQDLFTESEPLANLLPEFAETAKGATVFVGDIFSQMLMGNLVHTSTVLLRSHVARAVGRFDLDLKPCGEDYDFHFRTCRQGPVAFIDAASILYQRDFEDQLTHPRYALQFARNYLHTITRMLKRDRERIRLPKWMISAALAEAHGWTGHVAMDVGDTRLARPHLARCLWHKPLQIKAALMLVLSCLPNNLGNRLRRPYRSAKRALLRGLDAGLQSRHVRAGSHHAELPQ